MKTTSTSTGGNQGGGNSGKGPIQHQNKSSPATATNKAAPTAGGWTEHRSVQGVPYYYNTITKVSTYERPTSMSSHGGGNGGNGGGGVGGRGGAGQGNGPGNAGGWPSTTGNPSGGGRSNNPSK